MFMVTKTLTIAEDAYNLLLGNKFEQESFSEEIRRLLSRKKTRTLTHFFGILSDDYAEGMRSDLQKLKAANIKLLREKLHRETS